MSPILAQKVGCDHARALLREDAEHGNGGEVAGRLHVTPHGGYECTLHLYMHLQHVACNVADLHFCFVRCVMVASDIVGTVAFRVL